MARLSPLLALLLSIAFPVFAAPYVVKCAPKTAVSSLQAARDAVRALRGKVTGPVRVEIQPGTYSLTEPLVLQPQDSDITFIGVGKDRPLITGGEVITGWKEQSPGWWTAPVPYAAEWPLRALFVDGERAILARSPNTGYFRTVGKAPPFKDADGKEIDSSKQAFRFKPGDLQNSAGITGGNAIVFYHWETAMLPIKSVDEAAQTLTFTGEMKWPFWSNQRYYIENVKEALDAPGEFYLDRQAKLLYYRPRPGENMRTAQVIAPRQQQLVLLQGDPEAGTLVSNVRFENLKLAHTNYVLEPEGHSDWQAAVTVNAAVQATGANRCGFDNCEISGVGNYAVWFERGCKDNYVTHSYIHDSGAGGVRIGQAGVPAEPNVTSGNTVSNCLIRDVGKDFYGAHPVWIGHASYNTISHNEICDANYTGIACGWSWGYGASAANHNIIEYNHLHDLGRGKLCDMAAIYTLGIQPGTIIRNNLIHDIYDWEEGYGAGGIYPDEGSSQIVIENNVVYRTASGGLTIHYGQDLIARNNIFACGRDTQVHLGRRDKESSLTYNNNIVYYEEGGLFSRESDLKSGNNIYFNTTGEDMIFPLNKTFTEWQASGQDIGSQITDPKFRNPAKDDYTLLPDSPALKLGFKPIDTSTCGIMEPAELVKLAQGIKREKTAIPRRSAAPPLSVNDGFEMTPVGTNADVVTTYGEAGTASIRVSTEQAASGKRSLRFEDAPGLDQSYNPHIHYSPHIVQGIVTFSYDVRLGAGTELFNDWRDQASPFRTGPNLRIAPDGQLSTGDQKLLMLPHDQWVHIEVVSGLGKQADGTFAVSVTLPGQQPQKFEKLPCDPKCKELQWLGFVSNATDKVVFYLDNVKLVTTTPAK